MEVTCRLCDEKYKSPSFLFDHIKKSHKIGPLVKDFLICPLCGVRNHRYNAHRDHLLYCHRHTTSGEKQDFDSFSDFLVWKNDFELQQDTKYVCQSSCNILSTNYKRYFYQCCRSGVFRPGSIGKNRTKVESTCPSMISAMEFSDTKQVKVEYWSAHSGHEDEAEESDENDIIILPLPEIIQDGNSRSNKDFSNKPKTTKKIIMDINPLKLPLTSPNTIFRSNNPEQSINLDAPNVIFRSSPLRPSAKVDNSPVTKNTPEKVKYIINEPANAKTSPQKKNSRKAAWKNSRKSRNNYESGPRKISKIASAPSATNNNSMHNGNQVALINILPNGQTIQTTGTVNSAGGLMNMVSLDGSQVFVNSPVGAPANNMSGPLLLSGFNSQQPGQLFYTMVNTPPSNLNVPQTKSSVGDTTSTTKISTPETNTTPKMVDSNLTVVDSEKNEKNTVVGKLSTRNVPTSTTTVSSTGSKGVPVGKLPISRINQPISSIAKSTSVSGNPDLVSGNQVLFITLPDGQMVQAGGNICAVTPNNSIVSTVTVNGPNSSQELSNSTQAVSGISTLAVSQLSKISKTQMKNSKIPASLADIVTSASLSTDDNIMDPLPTESDSDSISADSMDSMPDENTMDVMQDDDSMDSMPADNSLDSVSTDDNSPSKIKSNDAQNTQCSFSNLVSVACSKSKIAIDGCQSQSATDAGYSSDPNIIFKSNDAPKEPSKSGATKVTIPPSLARTLIGSCTSPSRKRKKDEIKSKRLLTSESKLHTTTSKLATIPVKVSPSITSVTKSSIESTSLSANDTVTLLLPVTPNTMFSNPISSVLNSAIAKSAKKLSRTTSTNHPTSANVVPLNLLQNLQNSNRAVFVPGTSNANSLHLSAKSTLIEDSGNYYILEPVGGDESTTTATAPLEKMSNAETSEPLRKKLKLDESVEKMYADREILKKIEFYKLEMKYLTCQEECKKLKIKLAQAELKTEAVLKENDPEYDRKNQKQENENVMYNDEQMTIQALESSFSSENDSDVYNLIRTSVLRNFDVGLRTLSEKNEQLNEENSRLCMELESYRRKEKYHNLLQSKFSEEDF